jgi:hypothetical protein
LTLCLRRLAPALSSYEESCPEFRLHEKIVGHRIEVTASNLRVKGGDLDLLEICSFQNPAQAVGVSERERAGRV